MNNYNIKHKEINNISSSSNLEMLFFYHSLFLIFYWTISFVIMIYKGNIFPYTTVRYVLEMIQLFFYGFCEIIRLYICIIYIN